MKLVNWYVYRLAQMLTAVLRYTRFAIANRLSRRAITAPAGPVVSLTTYGRRGLTVYLAIESIASGRVLPSRIILWLDDENLYRELPPTLLRLKKRGLEVKLCSNYGPHTKYFPYLASVEGFTLPLVTADDDMLYDTNWLSQLWDSYQKNSEVINCHRARILNLKNNAIQPFSTWRFCGEDDSGGRVYLEGVSGVIYPPRFLHALRDAGDGFIGHCKKNDDAWLNVIALRTGYQVNQIARRPKHYPAIPGTDDMGLMHMNVGNFGDQQIANTYTESDLKMLSGGWHSSDDYQENRRDFRWADGPKGWDAQ